MSEQCSFGAVLEHFSLIGILSDFIILSTAVKVQFQSSFSALSGRLQNDFGLPKCNFGAVSEQFSLIGILSGLIVSSMVVKVQFQSSSSALSVRFQNDFRLLKCSFGAVTEQFQRCLRADSAKPAQCSFRAFPAHIECSFRAATAPLLAFQNENGDSDKQKCTSPAVPVEFQSSFNGGHESLTGQY